MVLAVYVVFFILAIILVFNEVKIHSVFSRYILVILLLILAMLKDGSVLPDYQVYLRDYIKLINGEAVRDIEISYRSLSLLFRGFGTSGFFGVLFVYSFVQLLLIDRLIIKNTDFYYYSALLYFVNFYIIFGLIQIRAGASLALCYYGLLNTNSPRRVGFSFLFAVFFHYSALVIYPLFFLARRKIDLRAVIGLSIIAIFLAFNLKSLIFIVINLMPLSYIQEKLITYTLSSRADQFQINFGGIYFVSKFIFLVVVLLHWKYLKFVTHNSRIFCNLYIFGIIAYVALSSFPEIAVRLSNYCFFSEVLLLPYFIRIYREKIVIKGAIILFAFVTLYVNINYLSYFQY